MDFTELRLVFRCYFGLCSIKEENTRGNCNQLISESELQLTKNEIALKLKSTFIDHENNLKQVKLYVNDILPQAEEIYRTAIKVMKPEKLLI